MPAPVLFLYPFRPFKIFSVKLNLGLDFLFAGFFLLFFLYPIIFFLVFPLRYLNLVLSEIFMKLPWKNAG